MVPEFIQECWAAMKKKKKDVQRLPPVNRTELVDFVRWKTFFRSLFYILSF